MGKGRGFQGGAPRGGGQMNMQKMMMQAQKMQAEMAKAQDEIKDMTFEASAGGGMVKAVASGSMELTSLTIDPEAVDPEDVDMLQDMVLAAANEALRGVAEMSSVRMNSVTGGMSIPGLM
jgi:DNA-binding YbaB/EbfC family protein